MKRRDFIAGGTLLGAAIALPSAWAQARPAAADPLAPNPAEFRRSLAAFVAKARPVDEGLKLDLPVLADNPGAVPVGVVLTAPLTEAVYLKELIILAELNPVPLAGRFVFSPLSGTTEVAMRLRLSQSQTVHALARLSDGRRHFALDIRFQAAAPVVALYGDRERWQRQARAGLENVARHFSLEAADAAVQRIFLAPR